MIPKSEISDLAEEQGLLLTTVEKDYVLGWLLYAISVGRLPNRMLAEDLKKWRAWYEQNKGSLYWDPAASRIRVRGVDQAPSEDSRGKDG